MLDLCEDSKERKNKKNRHPKYDELFSNLNINNKADKSIAPYIEILKNSDFERAQKSLKSFWKSFESNKTVKKTFWKFVDYLLENERCKSLFQESMQRYKLIWDNREIYEKVYNTTLTTLENQLSEIKWKLEWGYDVSSFNVKQIIKLLRWDVFVFNLWSWIIRFEKDFLYGDIAKQINTDKSDKPVYAFRMHVWDWAAIYSLNTIFNEMSEFVQNVDTGAKPYVWMLSWLLDTDFLKYRLEKKWRSKDNIEKFIFKYWTLWEIKLESIPDSINYDKISKRIKKHLKENDKNLVELYEKEWNKLQIWECLKKLIDDE